MVQLKAEYLSGMVRYLGFQYLMVQLKDSSREKLPKLFQFQYLMVQLKVIRSCHLVRLN